MVNIKSNVSQENSGNDIDQDFNYKISGFNIGTWSIYIAIAVLLSIGYIFVINYDIAKLIIPPGVDVEFQLDEMFWGLFVPNLAAILIAPIIWDKVCNLILTQRWMRSFISVESMDDRISAQKEGVKNKRVNLMLFKSILNIKPKFNRRYYLEAKCVDLDMRKFGSTFKSKLLGAISGSIGLTFLIASVLYPILSSDDLMPEALQGPSVLFLSIMIMQVVPIIISFIIPVNWVLNDVALRYRTNEGFVEDLGENMSKGIFRRFIGVGGLILGISVCYDLAYDKEAIIFINIWVTVIYFFLYFLLLNAGTLVVISLLYLKFYHEKKVNTVREGFAKYLILGETNVKTDSESSNGRIAPRIGETKEEKNTALSIFKLISVLVLLALDVYGQYYVLVVVGPFSS